MTNLQEDLTLALQRRAEAVTVEDHLDAILDDHNIVRFSSSNGATSGGAGGSSSQQRRGSRRRRRTDLGDQCPHATANGGLRELVGPDIDRCCTAAAFEHRAA